ncbi:hypothetical protein E2C01_003725 [Portunus trituberculatus]|uniref:Uncharacterized protein n=1 Tax=Portunus trituberculatus TaxID=210409 RepID=A0A5B7CMW3_PORTR|nr:hypothetical protein [Portunus trituberculatus]
MKIKTLGSRRKGGTQRAPDSPQRQQEPQPTVRHLVCGVPRERETYPPRQPEMSMSVEKVDQMERDCLPALRVRQDEPGAHTTHNAHTPNTACIPHNIHRLSRTPYCFHTRCRPRHPHDHHRLPRPRYLLQFPLNEILVLPGSTSSTPTPLLSAPSRLTGPMLYDCTFLNIRRDEADTVANVTGRRPLPPEATCALQDNRHKPRNPNIFIPQSQELGSLHD